MEYTFKKEEINFKNDNIRIRNIIEDYDDGRINLNPWFQRKFKNKIKSSIIESILLGFPISQIYLMEYIENEKKKYYVVDGKQRLATIISFCKGKQFDKNMIQKNSSFKCKDFEVYKELNGKSFKQLQDSYQDDIRSYNLSVIKISLAQNCDSKNITQVLSYVFEKVNTTSKALSKNEIWKAIYYGKLFEEIINIFNDKKLVINDWGFKDEEAFIDFILQVICMISGQYDNKNISNSIQLMLHDKSNDIKFVKKWTNKIKHILKKGRELFDLKDVVNGDLPMMRKWLMVSYNSFIKYHTQLLQNCRAEINNEIIELFKSSAWHKYSETWTTKKENIYGRIRLIDNVFLDVIQRNGIKLDEKRLFSKKDKEELWKKSTDHLCGICSQKIDNIDDAQIDHIIPWSLGGETTLDNAQLTHRTCNISKSNKIS